MDREAVFAHCRARFGTEAAYLWARFPDAAALRNPESGRWYAVAQLVERAKLGLDGEGKAFLKAVYFLPTDALIEGQAPGEDGLWHFPLATYYVHHLSLDPRKNFARFLYLAERMTEALEYQYDKMGYFYSNPPAQG